MKKILLFTIAAATCISAFAERKSHQSAKSTPMSAQTLAAKGTATNDTVTMRNILVTDTITLYTAGTDSGLVSGTDAYGDKGYAERYEFNLADSSIQVLGVVAEFGGTVNSTTTKTVTFKAWSQAAKSAVPSTTHVFYDGLPGTVLASKSNVSIKNLGIGATADTPKLFLFDTPTSFLTDSFYVGYDITYTYAGLNGDTIGVLMTNDGERTSVLASVQGADTIVNVKNATQYFDNVWHDNGTDNFTIADNFFLFAYVVAHNYTGVKGITRNNLTFFGNYPNPATNNTNIKFSLKKGTGVTIDIMDATGRMINTISEGNLDAGEHVISIETSSMAAGNYIYLLRTSNNDGIASQMTVIK